MLDSNQNSNPNCKNNSEQYTLEDNPKVYWHGSLVKQYIISSIVTKFKCDLGAVIVSFLCGIFWSDKANMKQHGYKHVSKSILGKQRGEIWAL